MIKKFKKIEYPSRFSLKRLKNWITNKRVVVTAEFDLDMVGALHLVDFEKELKSKMKITYKKERKKQW